MTVYFQVENDLLTDYCKYLFPLNNQGVCKVSESHDFGRLLIAFCRPSERPRLTPTGKNVLLMDLPLTDSTQGLNNKFLYFSSGDLKRLNSGLKALFNIDFFTYYYKAEGCGLSKKDIIDAFIISRRLVNANPDDALHKRVYRQEAEKRRKTMRLLLRRIYYLNESLDDTGINQ